MRYTDGKLSESEDDPVNIPDPEKFLASAVHYLLQGDEHDVATMLLQCDIKLEPNSYDDGFIAYLSGPRAVYEVLGEDEHPIGRAVDRAFNAVHSYYLNYTVRAQFLDTLDLNWRTELKEIAAGRGVHNQAVDIPNREIIMWRNLRFRSQSEVRIAAALDAVGVLFLPNCLARLGTTDHRFNREADFLVCSEGRWGILEVDGPFHPRAAEDHERDRTFQEHGILRVHRFTAEQCYNDAPAVVQRFLTLLAKNG